MRLTTSDKHDFYRAVQVHIREIGKDLSTGLAIAEWTWLAEDAEHLARLRALSDRLKKELYG